MTAICGWFGISRQAHNQMKQRQIIQEEINAQIIGMVQAIRVRHPRMGCRKLLTCLADDLLKANITIGRDRLFDLLRQGGIAHFPQAPLLADNIRRILALRKPAGRGKS